MCSVQFAVCSLQLAVVLLISAKNKVWQRRGIPVVAREGELGGGVVRCGEVWLAVAEKTGLASAFSGAVFFRK